MGNFSADGSEYTWKNLFHPVQVLVAPDLPVARLSASPRPHMAKISWTGSDVMAYPWGMSPEAAMREGFHVAC